MLSTLTKLHHKVFQQWLLQLDGLPMLALRLYLVPVFWMAGTNKIDFETFLPNDGVVHWFGESLGLPFPFLMAFLAGWTEILGAVFLLLGVAIRYISLPLIITMVVAAVQVHWQNGWAAIASGSDPEVAKRLEMGRDILQEYGHYDWLTAEGNWVILNNGVEFSVTYAVMLLVLFFYGGGRYISLDYWLKKSILKPSS